NASTGATLGLGEIPVPSDGSTTYVGSVAILGSDGFLLPGHYLVHVHDACGSILYSLPVTASYAPTASVTLDVTPASCGPISFDGGSYAAGSTWSGAPGAAPRSVSVPACAQGQFQGWTRSGGVSLGS